MQQKRQSLPITGTVLFIVALLGIALVGAGAVYGGSVLDYGQLQDTPADANYVAWLGTSGSPPGQVVTEDSYNSATGVDQGYQAGNWLLAVDGNFDNPAPADGDQVNIIFGGLGAADGTLWHYDFAWDNSIGTTNHGTVTDTSSGSCPDMQAGSYDETTGEKVINWSAPAGTYYIYRSLLASGAGNDASNGRYNYVDTVTTTTTSGSYTDNVGANTDSWHIVVPGDGTTITGCHSEPADPTAAELTEVVVEQQPPALDAAPEDGVAAPPGVVAAGTILLLLAALTAGLLLRRR